jgi:2-deoxy-D-gluconate 3-dehydrogenase
VAELPPQAWCAVIDSHLTSAFLCARHAAAGMRDRGTGGKVIDVESMYCLFGPSDFADHTAAKTGVVA